MAGSTSQDRALRSRALHHKEHVHWDAALLLVLPLLLLAAWDGAWTLTALLALLIPLAAAKGHSVSGCKARAETKEGAE